MSRVYLVWRIWEDDPGDTLEGIYIDSSSAEYAVNSRWELYRIESRLVRSQDRRL